MIADDRDLVRRLRRGDGRAFATFFDAHFAPLYRFARARLGDDDLAEEAVQTGLSTALHRIHTWRGEASLMTWLHTIVRHEIVRLAKRRRRDGEVLVLLEDAPDVEAAVASLESGEREDPDRALDRREVARRVQATLDRLPGRYGDVLEWKYVQGYAVSEIAERLGIGPKAAESLLTRAAWRSGVRRRRRVVALGLGVAAAVLVIGIPRVRESVSPGHRPAVRIEASHGPLRWTGDALETGDRGRAAVRLSGGVAVRLDTGTRLRFPTERVVVLERGAAYVILESGGRGAGDPAGPILRTSFGDVRHLGTRFEARLEDGALRLRVRDGQVRVGEGRAVVHAAATEEILVGPAGLLDRRRVALHGPVWGWTLAIAPAFHLEGRTLAELLTWIVEETGWRLEYHDPVLARRAGRIVLHGSLEHVAPDQALSIVAPTVGISFRVEDGVLEIGR